MRWRLQKTSSNDSPHYPGLQRNGARDSTGDAFAGFVHDPVPLWRHQSRPPIDRGVNAFSSRANLALLLMQILAQMWLEQIP
mmetsp:Transcript_17508/g.49046  ORF Transcript_17508/g.49046 Transcript_17508/m.49046 type:complete len:82 (-) Transcript_17508:838-1083(-)